MIRSPWLVALLALAAAPVAVHAADPQPAPAPAPAPAEVPDVDPGARAALVRAADFLRAQNRFAFSADIAYEVFQDDDGSTLEFGELRRYTVRRPDRVRIESNRRADGRRVMFFDGDRLTASSPDQNAYAFVKLKKHADIDEALHLIRDRIGIPMPLGELLASQQRRGLEGSFESGFLVGEEQLDGVTCEHVALRNEDTDIEVWVEKGAAPFVRRIHIAYQSLPGEPRFTARIFDWALSPDVADAVFAFDPPKDAERVRFAFGAPGAPPPPEKETKP